MSDLRQLFQQTKKRKLKAGKINDELAQYSTNGTLKCSLCNTMIGSNKLWEDHIGSKSHASKLQTQKKSKVEDVEEREVIEEDKEEIAKDTEVKKNEPDAISIQLDKFKQQLASFDKTQSQVDYLIDTIKEQENDDKWKDNLERLKEKAKEVEIRAINAGTNSRSDSESEIEDVGWKFKI